MAWPNRCPLPFPNALFPFCWLYVVFLLPFCCLSVGFLLAFCCPSFSFLSFSLYLSFFLSLSLCLPFDSLFCLLPAAANLISTNRHIYSNYSPAFPFWLSCSISFCLFICLPACLPVCLSVFLGWLGFFWWCLDHSLAASVPKLTLISLADEAILLFINSNLLKKNVVHLNDVGLVYLFIGLRIIDCYVDWFRLIWMGRPLLVAMISNVNRLVGWIVRDALVAITGEHVNENRRKAATKCE